MISKSERTNMIRSENSGMLFWKEIYLLSVRWKFSFIVSDRLCLLKYFFRINQNAVGWQLMHLIKRQRPLGNWWHEHIRSTNTFATHEPYQMKSLTIN